MLNEFLNCVSSCVSKCVTYRVKGWLLLCLKTIRLNYFLLLFFTFYYFIQKCFIDLLLNLVGARFDYLVSSVKR